MLSHTEARKKVVEIAGLIPKTLAMETVALREASGRILAETICADRDYPPFNRSTRDGFAVRAADCAQPGATLQLIGEIRAGENWVSRIESGHCVQIMTGAAVPAGADAVVMIEHTKVSGTAITFEKSAISGQNVVSTGTEGRKGQTMLSPGARIGFAEMAIAAQVGVTQVKVTKRPCVAILSTGDEVVEFDKTPGPFQIRNSNSVSLGEQARLAGGEPVILGNAHDSEPELRALIEKGLQEDILVLSGGVSMGKYDFVERVLTDLGAEFYFDALAIRPGRPAVFGKCREKLVFGLPGNPVSTMVTFELLAVPAIDILSGTPPRALPLMKAKLTVPLKEKPGLTHFLPAQVTWPNGEAEVKGLPWQGSGDIVALAQANCFLVVPQEKLEWNSGELIDVLPLRGMM
ncbi:MAG: molybdopterin molybdotransferase MoeA [Acidobacteria bacterium]|nr:molybdopterin molybdotransferase MoeA [Acidobacteriota bacterium]